METNHTNSGYENYETETAGIIRQVIHLTDSGVNSKDIIIGPCNSINNIINHLTTLGIIVNTDYSVEVPGSGNKKSLPADIFVLSADHSSIEVAYEIKGHKRTKRGKTGKVRKQPSPINGKPSLQALIGTADYCVDSVCKTITISYALTRFQIELFFSETGMDAYRALSLGKPLTDDMFDITQIPQYIEARNIIENRTPEVKATVVVYHQDEDSVCEYGHLNLLEGSRIAIVSSRMNFSC